jgi:hypothetical protein
MVTLFNTEAFARRISEIRGGVFLPKYYDPKIGERQKELAKNHNLFRLGDLIKQKHISVSTGDEIGKMAYGTGRIPFIRTSDVSNWEIKADAKHGVSAEIFEDYAASQDVQEGDLLFVRDGTYLVGQVCMVTADDLPCLYQSHLLKFRVSENSPVSKWMLLAALSAPFVKRQIRSKQFTADIIDTIGHRFLELLLPIPKRQETIKKIEKEVSELIAERGRMRRRLVNLPLLAEGKLSDLDERHIYDDSGEAPESTRKIAFSLPFTQLKSTNFIPKYHSPEILKELSQLEGTCELTPISALVSRKILSWSTGIEVGKMAYGTGAIPFIRTSDISNWELKGDPKQGVSEAIYEDNKQDVMADDIFIVRDGTYLVGVSCILTEHDTKILYCGGLYKLRVCQPNKLDPFLLLALLNTPIVRRQMRSKQFTRDIIDTLGKRLFEIILPVPKDIVLRKRIAEETRRVIETRVQLRNRARELAFEVEGLTYPEAAADLEDDLIIQETSAEYNVEKGKNRKREA